MTTPQKKSAGPKKKGSQSNIRRSSNQAAGISPLAIYGFIGGLVVLVAALLLLQTTTRPGPIEGLQIFSGVERGHTSAQVTYPQTPPAGGQHNPAWQNCGVYTEPVVNEYAVHSLEHGAIWITYQTDLPAEQVQTLQNLTRRSGYRLLSPYPDLPAPVVASAWGYQIQLDSADDPRLVSFIERYEQNPNGPEPGAACSGGVGTPG